MPDDPIKKTIAMLTEIIETLRGIGVPVPRDESIRSSNRPKLSAREVRSIHELKRKGFSQRAIAEIYDIAQPTVSRILRGIYHK